MSKVVKYDAFISYRHIQPDSEIAEKLHKKLENFRLPKSVAKKIGKPRLSRVFRDEAELAVAESLSDEIDRALRNSKFLICVCSPEYLESVWCMKEVESFLQYSDRKHILLVLAKGEPDTSFPEVLLYEEVFDLDDDKISKRVPREPLAADCRAEDSKERNALIDKAVIRLIAPIVGVEYDDLQQRHRKEQNARRRNRVLFAFGILSLIIAICIVFLIKISNQNAIIKQRYADTLATTSTALLNDGKRKDAVYAARLALTEKQNKNYSDLATKALVNALGIYDFPDEFSCDEDYLLPCSVSDFNISPAGNYIDIYGLDYSRYIIDANTGELIFFFVMEQYAEPVFDGERGIAFYRENESLHYFDFNSLSEVDLGYEDAEIISFENAFAVLEPECLHIYRGTNELVSMNYKEALPEASDNLDTVLIYDAPTDSVFIFVMDYTNYVSYVFRADLYNKTLEETLPDYLELMNGMSADSNTIQWIVNDTFDTYLVRYDLSNPDNSKEITLSDYYYGSAVSGNNSIIYNDHQFIIFDENLNIIETVESKDYVYLSRVTDEGILLFESGGSFYIINDGTYKYVDVRESSGYFAHVSKYINGVLYTAGVGDNHISTYKYRKSEYLLSYTNEYEEFEYTYDEEEENYLLTTIQQYEKEFNEDRIAGVVKCKNADLCLAQLWDRKVCIYDTNTGERIKTIYSIEGYITFFCYDEKSEYYYINGDNLDVYDKDFKNIFEIPDCSLKGFDSATGYPIIEDWNIIDSKTYIVTPVTYDDIIRLADEMLNGYTPDERIKEKYSLE